MLSPGAAAHRADEATAAAAAALAEAARRAEAVAAPVVICGFGELGQTVANMLDSPAVSHTCAPAASPVYAAQEAELACRRDREGACGPVTQLAAHLSSDATCFAGAAAAFRT